MPRKLYPGEGLDRRRFVRTGVFRYPKKGEWYLSGAVPQVYQARADLGMAYDIMRPAAADEVSCRCCGQRLPDAQT